MSGKLIPKQEKPEKNPKLLSAEGKKSKLDMATARCKLASGFIRKNSGRSRSAEE